VNSSDHIEVRNGVYYVSGTRISLDSIVYAFRDGLSPESIREDFEGLSLVHVYGVIAFYLDNQAEVNAYLASRKAAWAALEAQGAPPSDELRARVDRARHSGLLPRR
jgi:uncharacterized protein (DUF433 family)